MKILCAAAAVAMVIADNTLCCASSNDVWKGALIGAGATVVGEAIIDSATKQPVEKVTVVQTMPSTDAYQKGYGEGFNNGYKAGYTAGYKDGVKDESEQHKK